MGQPVDSKQGGIQDAMGVSAVSKASANTTVTASNGPIGIMTDIPSFTGVTTTGLWSVGATRCRINSIPVINTASVGIGVAPSLPSGTSGPLLLAQSDTKVKAL
jgi:hypothetical protein